MSRRKAGPGLWRAYRVPALLGVASIVGLVGALVGDGVLDALSWAALGGLLAVIVWALRRR